MKVLVGTSALALSLPSGVALPRPIKDVDFLATSDEERPQGEDFIRADLILSSYDFKAPHASLDELLTLKVSHSAWVVTDLAAWTKHVKDVQYLKKLGAKVNEDLYQAAYGQWEQSFGRKAVKLDESKEVFFNNSVKRYYDHDSVHAAVALSGAPAFNKILADGEEVRTSKSKFEALSESEKARLVFEEVMVLSLERDLIPAYWGGEAEPLKGEIYASYSKQLRLLITQYSRGYFPRWAIENYPLVMGPPLNYWRLFQDSKLKKLL